MANDQHLPTPKTTPVQVVISIPRHTLAPKFDQDNYTVDIVENMLENSQVTQIKATVSPLKVRNGRHLRSIITELFTVATAF